ncbi:hypothetical protein [Thermococcus sp.]|uniref:hypothetical protein n=1 Tax=Thermococcus sp. TaxID=35749 RepID=UPI0025F5D8E2|nr:hypothetical protein [Thermococcus sp.]
MKWIGVVIYFASLFLLYISAGMDVAITLASVSLSVVYVWTAILWRALHKKERFPKLIHLVLLANLILIFISAFVMVPLGAILLLIILLALFGFVLLMRYGLSRWSVVPDADLRLKYFGILLLGFFSLNPLIEGVSTSNWIEAIASVMLIFGGYLMFEEARTPIRGSKQAEGSQ